MLYFAIIIGYSLGTLLAFFLSKWLLAAVSRRFATRREQEQFIKVMGGVLGAIVLAPGIFLTAIGGAYLEKNVPSVAEVYSALGPLGQVLIPIVGFTTVIAATVTAAVGVGALVGAKLARNLFPDRRPPG